MKRKIKNLLFDFGNVLIDIDLDEAYARLESLFRKDFKREVVEKAYLDYECGRISTDLFINGILSQCEHRVHALDVIEAWNSMLIGIPEYRLDMLDKLRLNYNVYLLSNTNEIHEAAFNRMLQQTCGYPTLAVFFDKIYLSHRIGLRKPDPRAFELIIHENNLIPEQTLFIDDSIQHIEAASALGLKTIHVSGDMTMEKDIFRQKPAL